MTSHFFHKFLDVLLDSLVFEPLVSYVKRKYLGPTMRRISSAVTKRLTDCLSAKSKGTLGQANVE